jgi:hypothetical protein
MELTAESNESIPRTCVVHVPQTGITFITVNRRLHTDSLALLQVCDPLTYFLDNSAEFMAQGYGRAFLCNGMRASRLGYQIVSSEILVQICPADTNKRWLDLLND